MTDVDIYTIIFSGLGAGVVTLVASVLIPRLRQWRHTKSLRFRSLIEGANGGDSITIEVFNRSSHSMPHARAYLTINNAAGSVLNPRVVDSRIPGAIDSNGNRERNVLDAFIRPHQVANFDNLQLCWVNAAPDYLSDITILPGERVRISIGIVREYMEPFARAAALEIPSERGFSSIERNGPTMSRVVLIAGEHRVYDCVLTLTSEVTQRQNVRFLLTTGFPPRQLPPTVEIITMFARAMMGTWVPASELDDLRPNSRLGDSIDS